MGKNPEPLAVQWEDPESLAAAEAERQAAIKADKLAALEALLWPPPKGAAPAQGAHSGAPRDPNEEDAHDGLLQRKHVKHVAWALTGIFVLRWTAA